MDPDNRLLLDALREDLGHGDVTTEAVVDESILGTAEVVGREPFVLSGSIPFKGIFRLLDTQLKIAEHFADGDEVPVGRPVFTLSGRVRSILQAERTALNLLQRLSGIATLTRNMVCKLDGLPCRLLDTRKTTPLWRGYEKQAVRHGGGYNHRLGLSDGILIKDNHIAAAGGVREALRRARRYAPHTLKIEIEVDNLDQFEEALAAGADIIMLDNFPLDTMRQAVQLNRGRALLEASGGITLDSIRAVAETGVDLISCGALTHSARAIDIGLDLTIEQ